MVHVSVAEVQQWLEPTKLNLGLGPVDAELDATAFQVVASALQGRYDTSTWVDANTTPDLVRKILSMLVAGYTYNRQYSENEDVATYGNWLIRYATTVAQGIDSGQDVLIGQDSFRDPNSFPVFFPTDVATDLADPQQGGSVTDPAGAPRSFSMGQVF